MRMWNVDPRIMCRQHLLGEHVETHMLVGSISKRISLFGYATSNLLEVGKLRYRHDLLAKEMLRRGFAHNSPLPDFDTSYLGEIEATMTIDVAKAKAGLLARCNSCSEQAEMLAARGMLSELGCEPPNCIL